MVKWERDASTGFVVRAGAIAAQQSAALAEWRHHPLCAGVEPWMCVPRPMPVLACCFLPTPAPFPSLYGYVRQCLQGVMRDGRPHFQQRVRALEVGRTELEPVVSMLDALIRHHGRCIDGFHVESAPVLANYVMPDDGGLWQTLQSSCQVLSLTRDDATARAREARANVAAARIAERQGRAVAREQGKRPLSASQALRQAQLASAADTDSGESAADKDMAFATPHLFVRGCGTESDTDEENVRDALSCAPTEDHVAKALSRHERRLHAAAARRARALEVDAAVLTLCERKPTRAVILFGHVYCRRMLCERRDLLARCLARLEMLDGRAVEALQHRKRRRLRRRRRWSQHGAAPGGIQEQDMGRTLGILDSKDLRMPAIDIVLDAVLFLQRVVRGNKARKYARYVKVRRDRRNHARILFGMLCRIWRSRKRRDRFRDAIDILRRCRRILPLQMIRCAIRRAARRRIVARRWKVALAWSKRAGKRERVAKRWRAAHFLQRVARGTIARVHVQHRRTMAQSAKAAEEQRLRELRIEKARRAARALRLAQLLNPSARRYLRKKRGAMDALQAGHSAEQGGECEPVHPVLKPLLVRLYRALDGEDAIQQAAKDEHRLASDDALLAESRDAAVEGQGVAAVHISRVSKMRMAVFARPRACDIFGPAEQAFIRDLAVLYNDAHTAVARAPPPTLEIVTNTYLRSRSRPAVDVMSLTEKVAHGSGPGLDVLLRVAAQLPTRLLLLLLPPELTMSAVQSNVDNTSGISDEVSTKIAVLRALRASHLRGLARALQISEDIDEEARSADRVKAACDGVQHYEEIARQLGRWEPRRRVIRCFAECCRVKIPTASQMPGSEITARRNARVFHSQLSLFHFTQRVNTDLWLADTQVDISEEAMVAQQFARRCVKEDATYAGRISADTTTRDVGAAKENDVNKLKSARSENIVRQRIAASNIHRPGSAVAHMSEVHKRLRAYPRMPQWVAKHEAEIGTTLPALTGDADRIGDLRKVTQSVRAGEVRKAVEWRLLCRRFGFGMGPPGFEHPRMPPLRGGAGASIAHGSSRQKNRPDRQPARTLTESKPRAPASAGRSRKLQMLPLTRNDGATVGSNSPSRRRAAAAAKPQPCFSFIRTSDLCPNCLGWKQPHPSTGACLRCGSRSGPGPQSGVQGGLDSAILQIQDSGTGGSTELVPRYDAGSIEAQFAKNSRRVHSAPRARSANDDNLLMQDAAAIHKHLGSAHDKQIDTLKARANKDLERQVAAVSMFMGIGVSDRGQAAPAKHDATVDRYAQDRQSRRHKRHNRPKAAVTKGTLPSGMDVNRFRDGLLFDSFIAHCAFRHFTPPHHINRTRPREAMWNEASAVGAEWATALRRFGGVGNMGELLQSGAADMATSSDLMARVSSAAAEVTDAVEQGMGGDGFGRVLRRDARGLASVISRMLAMMVEQLPKARQQWDTWARDCVDQAEARATSQRRHKQQKLRSGVRAGPPRASSARSRPPRANRPVTALSRRHRNRQLQAAGSVGMAHLARSHAYVDDAGTRTGRPVMRPASAPVVREEEAPPAVSCADGQVQRKPLGAVVNHSASISARAVVDDRGAI